MAIQKFDLRFKSAKRIAPNTLHLCFERSDGEPLAFVPGQFITFLLKNEAGELKRRSYSIASLPDEEGKAQDIEIAISYIQGGTASETLFHLKAGDELHAMGPAGRLIMQDDGIKRYILAGTGTGIAPYRAMLPDLKARLDADPDFSVVVIQGVQYREDVLYGDDFLELQSHPRFSFIACLSRDELQDQQRHEQPGYVQGQFDALDLEPEQDIVYLCGNPNMIDDAFRMLVDQGFSTKSIRREKYISSN